MRMKILNFGSLNIDLIYTVPHIAAPGETVSSTGLTITCGGKGLNQSVALSRAGVPVCHAGMIGPDGDILMAFCRDNGIDTTYIRASQTRTGTATIQVGADGQNSILLYGGANRQITEAFIDEVLNGFSAGDILLLQNEINLLDRIADKAFAKGMTIFLNPAPYDGAVIPQLLDKVTLLILNEIEGAQITGQTDPSGILTKLQASYPKTDCLLTLGENGVMYQHGGTVYSHGIYKVDTIDTTAAGDTFTGYFIACTVRGHSPDEALRIASKAAAVAVSRKGAAVSIPTRSEIVI
jgi:ribokinase